ncbi:MAG: response regulator [Syntrophobacter sp.]
MIAEDDRHVSLIYQVGLPDEVFERFTVTSGDEVLESFKEWKPEILILDIMLPGISGYAVLKAIREEMNDTETSIIMATSLSGRDAVLDCVQLGIQGYLVKPFSHREIAGKVLGYFQKVNSERALQAIGRLQAFHARAEQAKHQEPDGDAAGKSDGPENVD